jgi:hypothetical protein
MELHKMSYQLVNNFLIRYHSQKFILKNVPTFLFRPNATFANFILADVLPII